MKKAFTLLELLLSVTIISFIVLALFHLTSNLKTSNKNLERNVNKTLEEAKTFRLLYKDFLESTDANLSINTKENDLHEVSFQTKNTLFNIERPYVCYRVNDEKTLFRVESILHKTCSFKQDAILDVKVTLVVKNVELFNIYKNKKDFFIYLKSKQKEPIYFEVHREF